MTPDFLHGGVPRASGAVHVGPAHLRVGMYLRDARGYARSGLDWCAALERQRLEAAARHAENMRRSYVGALACLLSWLDGDAGLGGVSGEGAADEDGDHEDRDHENRANRAGSATKVGDRRDHRASGSGGEPGAKHEGSGSIARARAEGRS
jgi:hypothetical protein